jgi:hypothetical protein
VPADGLRTLGSVGVGRLPTANALEVQGNASKSTAGDWLANSDRRIKQDPAVVSEGAGSIYGFDASQPAGIGNGMAFNFDQPIRSFGIDIVDLSSGISVVVPGLTPTLTLANPGQTMSPRFFGVISDIPFSPVRFHWGTAGDAVGFDDLR